jgi:hypothetical protein
MGQVIHLSVPWAAYPVTTEALDAAERILLLGVRWWVADYRQSVDPLPRLCEAMRSAGPREAAFSVDRLMAVIARTALRPVAIHCPRCRHLSRDETSVLYAASLVQAGESRTAERALRTALLSAPGAEFALGPLEGLGELFTRARLLFRRRQVPVEYHSPDDAMWIPADENQSIH